MFIFFFYLVQIWKRNFIAVYPLGGGVIFFFFLLAILTPLKLAWVAKYAWGFCLVLFCHEEQTKLLLSVFLYVIGD